MKLINKAALIAAIKERLKHNGTRAELDRSAFMAGREKEDEDILTLLDTLEVKEVDLDVMQRMKECPYRQVGCTMYEGKILECRGACNWVVDYLTLKELKAQKGE